jgi:hypothetical protein
VKELEKGNFPKIYTLLTNFSPLIGHDKPEEPQQKDEEDNAADDFVI